MTGTLSCGTIVKGETLRGVNYRGTIACPAYNAGWSTDGETLAVASGETLAIACPAYNAGRLAFA